MSKKIADVVTKLVTLLASLESAERGRAIDAALLILGDAPNASGRSGAMDKREKRGGEKENRPLYPKLQTWMKQHNVTSDQLEQLYDLQDGTVSVIAAGVPGKKSGEKARNTYLLQGLQVS